MKRTSRVAAALAALVWSAPAVGAPFLSSTDFIIAIDTDPVASLSDYPDGENPLSALDNNSGTKYLNFGEINTGIMVKPFSGPSIIQSMVLTTANDAVARDPASWAIYGTNENVDLLAPGVDDGDSLIANWTLISQGNVALPAARETVGPVLSFANSTAYSTYRILFPTVKDANAANSMQVADINLFTTNNGTGTSILSTIDDVAAFQLPVPDSRYGANEAPRFVLDGTGPNFTVPSQSRYPANENPPLAVDGIGDVGGNKYLNFGKEESGFIVTPAGGSSHVRSFQLTTAGDAPGRDPASWQLYGTSQPITSADNSRGLAETWTLVDAGTLALPEERNTLGPVVTVNNAASYSSYKMLFPTLKDTNAAGVDSMQLAEASFFASTDGMGPDLLNAGDSILAIDGTVPTGLETKYLNFGTDNSGLIITPAAGAKVMTSFQITTANDAPERDPASYQLFGTNATIASADNSQGNGEAWTLISSGALTLPDERETDSTAVSFTNTTSYKSYKLIFPTLKQVPDPENPGMFLEPNSMQIGGLQFFDSSVAADVDLDNDGDVDGNDFLLIQRTNPSLIGDWKTQFGAAVGAAGSVPEPGCGVLALLAGAGGALCRRKAPQR
jgi:hypothetical protein